MAFLSYKIEPKDIDDTKKEFEELLFEDQQKFLISLLDKNLLYVSYCDMEDKSYVIPEEVKKLNRQFYEEVKTNQKEKLKEQLIAGYKASAQKDEKFASNSNNQLLFLMATDNFLNDTSIKYLFNKSLSWEDKKIDKATVIQKAKEDNEALKSFIQQERKKHGYSFQPTHKPNPQEEKKIQYQQKEIDYLKQQLTELQNEINELKKQNPNSDQNTNPEIQQKIATLQNQKEQVQKTLKQKQSQQEKIKQQANPQQPNNGFNWLYVVIPGAVLLVVMGIIIAYLVVYLKSGGTGKIEISKRGKKEKKDLDEYFTNSLLNKKEILRPLELLNKQNDYNLKIRVKGGGITGQLEAIRLGIAKALLEVSPEYRTTLKGFGLLTRDPRRVERKKIGLKKARKATQYSKQNLQSSGYKKLTDIQEKVIPLILEGKDVIAQSRTGTGKTAAFIIPSLEKIEPGTKPQILVLVPTRELALQVSEETEKLSQNSKLRILAVYGGASMENQLRAFRFGVDVVIGTPGRILDHLARKSLQLTNLKFVILDEADEMINKGFLADIEKIIKMTPAERQTLLFSATITPQVSQFANLYLKNPERISGETKNAPENDIKHYYLESASRQKSFFLVDFLLLHSSELIIIFANTKRMVEQINERLSKERLKVDYIHSDLSQSRRTRVFNKFRTKQISLLVATDVAARGLHVDDIAYVINYDFPQSSEFYIHRIGRTARQKRYKIEPLSLPNRNQINQILEDKLLEKIINKIEKTEVRQKNNEKIKKLSEKYGADKLVNTLFNLLAKSDYAKNF
ncbi:6855_t:CDS:2 [Entrophospora sp. SA101]|nr:6855_t:CDS:2 [Entrophospora sp. SA101]